MLARKVLLESLVPQDPLALQVLRVFLVLPVFWVSLALEVNVVCQVLPVLW